MIDNVNKKNSLEFFFQDSPGNLTKSQDIPGLFMTKNKF